MRFDCLDVMAVRLFAMRCFRSLYHRGNTRGLRVINIHGIGVMGKEARAWSALNPPLLPAAAVATGEPHLLEPLP